MGAPAARLEDGRVIETLFGIAVIAMEFAGIALIALLVWLVTQPRGL